MSFIGSPFVNSRSSYGSNSSLNRTASPSKYSTGYSTYSSSYSPSNYNYTGPSTSNYSPSNYSSNYSPSYSSYKPYSSSPRSSYEPARLSRYDSGLSLKSSSTNSLNDLSYLNRSSPSSSYLSTGNGVNNFNSFRRSSLNSRKRHNTLSPARERMNSFSSSNFDDHYSSPTIVYSNYLPNSSVTRSRPSSTSSTTSQTASYKVKDYSDKADSNVNNDNLSEKPTENDFKSSTQPLVSQSTIINQQTLDNSVQARKNKTIDLDYKKMYEDLLVEFENFKAEVNRKEQDYLREKRKMERKISELEEESVQMESVKEENLRLKNENGALVRVISKLSK